MLSYGMMSLTFVGNVLLMYVQQGVLSVTIEEVGSWVINKQTPNRQLWWSSPIRYGKQWVRNTYVSMAMAATKYRFTLIVVHIMCLTWNTQEYCHDDQLFLSKHSFICILSCNPTYGSGPRRYEVDLDAFSSENPLLSWRCTRDNRSMFEDLRAEMLEKVEIDITDSI